MDQIKIGKFIASCRLEKPIQNVLAFPTAMGLSDHAVSRFLNANPVLLALVAGLFPGLFEETGRLVAFKTVLKKRKNRETSISYGTGTGGYCQGIGGYDCSVLVI